MTLPAGHEVCDHAVVCRRHQLNNNRGEMVPIGFIIKNTGPVFFAG